MAEKRMPNSDCHFAMERSLYNSQAKWRNLLKI
ncbi:MAG: hypothetical protein JWQ38_2903 [Flavipsychrobacter sp.]|nr:hypothetical protein [Flavipsychrobacter sp.]